MFDPSDYPRTREAAGAEDRADERREYIREHACHQGTCDEPFDATKKCDGCGDHFCDMHRYDDLCARCLAIDEAADELVETERLKRAA